MISMESVINVIWKKVFLILLGILLLLQLVNSQGGKWINLWMDPPLKSLPPPPPPPPSPSTP